MVFIWALTWDGGWRGTLNTSWNTTNSRLPLWAATSTQMQNMLPALISGLVHTINAFLFISLPSFSLLSTRTSAPSVSLWFIAGYFSAGFLIASDTVLTVKGTLYLLALVIFCARASGMEPGAERLAGGLCTTPTLDLWKRYGGILEQWSVLWGTSTSYRSGKSVKVCQVCCWLWASLKGCVLTVVPRECTILGSSE